MAYYGLSKPFIAKLDAATGGYSEGFQCGKAVGTSIAPVYAETTLYGDNEEAENVKEFSYATLTVTTTTLPAVAESVVLGHEIKENDDSYKSDSVVYKGADEANYIGYGFCMKEKVGGITTYKAAVIWKAKLTQGTETYNTKGESIEFVTPELSGKAVLNNNGEWREKRDFTTETDAVSWIKICLNITDSSSESNSDSNTSDSE